MGEHTQGPWSAELQGDMWVVEGDGGNPTIAVMTEPGDSEQAANARLVAAAPELLEACEAALAHTDYAESIGEPQLECCQLMAGRLRAAIAKAKEGVPHAET